MEIKKDGSCYFIRLNRGEDPLESLILFAKEHKIRSGSFTGIGAVEDPTIGYYDFEKRIYLRTELKGDWEVANLTGNLTILEGEPFPHPHVVLSDPEGNVRGGHLFGGKVSLTVEIAVQSYSFEMERQFDQETGLKLIQ